MGILVPVCITTDGHSLYGVATGPNYGPDASTDLRPRAILIKSNRNPSSLAAISWSVISTVPLEAVYDISKSSGFQTCIVDELGVFTYMDLTVYKPQATMGTPGGIRYSPAFNSSGPGSTGLGGWKIIDTATPYLWNSSSISTVLFNVKDTTGTNTVIQAWYNNVTSSINFGILDNTFSRFSMGPSWVFDILKVSIRHINHHNGTLFLLSNLPPPTHTVSYVTIPFKSPVISATAPATLFGYGPFNVSSTYNPLLTGFFGDNYYVIHREGSTNSTDILTTINFANVTGAHFNPDVTLGQLVPTSVSSNPLLQFQAFGGLGSPGMAFIEQLAHNDSIISALNLDGPNIGQLQKANWKINVTETFGLNPNPPNMTSGNSGLAPGSGSGSGSTSHHGAVIGGVVGGLAAIIAVLGFLYYRRHGESVATWRITKKDGAISIKKQKQYNAETSDDYLLQSPGTVDTWALTAYPQLQQQHRQQQSEIRPQAAAPYSQYPTSPTAATGYAYPSTIPAPTTPTAYANPSSIPTIANPVAYAYSTAKTVPRIDTRNVYAYPSSLPTPPSASLPTPPSASLPTPPSISGFTLVPPTPSPSQQQQYAIYPAVRSSIASIATPPIAAESPIHPALVYEMQHQQPQQDVDFVPPRRPAYGSSSYHDGSSSRVRPQPQRRDSTGLPLDEAGAMSPTQSYGSTRIISLHADSFGSIQIQWPSEEMPPFVMPEGYTQGPDGPTPMAIENVATPTPTNGTTPTPGKQEVDEEGGGGGESAPRIPFHTRPSQKKKTSARSKYPPVPVP
ncbi:hypothetical protein BGZ98_002916 [Dissophora globulifera]|nr:hypothetical protein BGZ98_002916 [Dissophora globulifera]